MGKANATTALCEDGLVLFVLVRSDRFGLFYTALSITAEEEVLSQS